MKLRWIIALFLLASEHWGFWQVAYGIRHHDISESYQWLLTFWFVVPPLTSAIVLAPWRYQVVATTMNAVVAAFLYRSIRFYEPSHFNHSVGVLIAQLLVVMLIAAAIGGFVRAIVDRLNAANESRFWRRFGIAIIQGIKLGLICACAAIPVLLMLGPDSPVFWSRVPLIIVVSFISGLTFGFVVGLLVALTYNSPLTKKTDTPIAH